MGVAKVILNNETLIDVTDKTVDEGNLLSGETALRADGETVRGNVVVPTKTSDLVNDSGYISTETDPTVPSWAKAANKPSYTATEVGALPDTTSIPSKTSDLTNDSGFITSYTETDPTVPAWAKQSTKPTYTASEVGALPDTTSIPSKTSDLTNDSGYISTETDPTVPSWAKQSTKPSYTAIEVGAQPTITANGLLKGNGSGTISAAVSGTDYQAPLPSQTGNNGKFLTTNGSALSWATVDALPSQSGHIGQFLYTNGTTVSWEDSPSDVMLVTLTGTGEGDLSADKTVEEIIEAAILDGKQVNLVFDEYIYPLISYTQTDVVFEISGSTELLIVDGSSDNGNDYWDAYSVPIALPSQSGQSGKFLTTNGTAASWGNIPTEIFVATYGTTTYADVLAAYNSGKFIVCQHGDYCIPLSCYESTYNNFAFVYSGGTYTKVYGLSSTSGWNVGDNRNFVQTTRTINGKALSSNITLTASDVGALPSSTSIPTKTSDLTNDSGFATETYVDTAISTAIAAAIAASY